MKSLYGVANQQYKALALQWGQENFCQEEFLSFTECPLHVFLYFPLCSNPALLSPLCAVKHTKWGTQYIFCRRQLRECTRFSREWITLVLIAGGFRGERSLLPSCLAFPSKPLSLLQLQTRSFQGGVAVVISVSLFKVRLGILIL